MTMTKAALTVFNVLYVPGEHDGDTFRCTGDVRPIAPDVTRWEPKVRLAVVNAPERGQPGSDEARDLLRAWLFGGNPGELYLPKPFNLVCYGRDKYGRLLADAERGQGLLSAHLLEHGIPRMTRKQLGALALTSDTLLMLADRLPE